MLLALPHELPPLMLLYLKRLVLCLMHSRQLQCPLQQLQKLLVGP
jgi:hypothetical protein